MDGLPVEPVDCQLECLQGVFIEELLGILEVGKVLDQRLRNHVRVLVDEVVQQIRTHHFQYLSHCEKRILDRSFRGCAESKYMIGKIGIFGGMSGRFGAVVGPTRSTDVGITIPTGE